MRRSPAPLHGTDSLPLLAPLCQSSLLPHRFENSAEEQNYLSSLKEEQQVTTLQLRRSMVDSTSLVQAFQRLVDEKANLVLPQDYTGAAYDLFTLI